MWLCQDIVKLFFLLKKLEDVIHPNFAKTDLSICQSLLKMAAKSQGNSRGTAFKNRIFRVILSTSHQGFLQWLVYLSAASIPFIGIRNVALI